MSAQFDLVLGNPPYIPTADLAGLMPEVARYEPRTALDGGTDGCAAYRRLVPALPRLLTPTGVAVLEIGAGQAETAVGLARQAGLATELRPDLSGNSARPCAPAGAAMKKPFGSAGQAV